VYTNGWTTLSTYRNHFEDLCIELVALVVLKGFDFTMTLLNNNFVKLELDYSEKHFKISFPPVVHNLLRFPLNYEFERTKEYFIYCEIDLFIAQTHHPLAMNRFNC
jgi:hypothetical protein